MYSPHTHYRTLLFFPQLWETRLDITTSACGGEGNAEQNCSILYVRALFSWLWGLPPKHAYRSQQTEKTVTHAFVSAHVHHSYHSPSHPPPPSFWIHFYYRGRFQNKQTWYPPISAVSPCPLWTFPFAIKYICFNNVTRKGWHSGAAMLAAKNAQIQNISAAA